MARNILKVVMEDGRVGWIPRVSYGHGVIYTGEGAKAMARSRAVAREPKTKGVSVELAKKAQRARSKFSQSKLKIRK